MRNLSELIDFLNHTMSMSEVYQPAMILYLLEQGGVAGKTELAKMLSGYDESVVEYYENIVMQWPKRTLTKHRIVSYVRANSEFRLNFDLSDPHLVEDAKNICETKLLEWIERRRATKSTDKQVTSSRRYLVLKAARGKCELCGISSKLVPIDIDHIVPRRQADRKGYVLKDGQKIPLNDPRNLQALCLRCNRAKRDTDTTDFRPSQQKLIRDHIPDIIEHSGRRPIIKHLRGRELTNKLFDKLVEEHAELIESRSLEEIVDMIEVLFAIGQSFGHKEEDVLQKLMQKRNERGGFEKGIFLIDIQDIALDS